MGSVGNVLVARDLVGGAGWALAVVVAVMAVTVALRHDDETNRVWLSGLLAALACVAMPTLLASGGARHAVSGLTCGAAVYAVGALWSGARALAGRRSHVLRVLLLAVVYGAVVAVGHSATGWLARLVLVVIAAAALTAVLELRRGPMRRNVNCEILAVALVLAAAGALVCAVAVGNSRWDAGATGWTASMIVAAGTGVLALVAVPTLTALRVERHGVWWAIREETDLRRLSVLGADEFERAADDRLERSERAGVPATLVLARVDELGELNAALGREAGDLALAHVAEVLRQQVPPSALIGHLRAGLFGVLSSRDPNILVSSIETGMLSAAVPIEVGIRVTMTFASASTAEVGPSYAGLLGSAQAVMGDS